MSKQIKKRLGDLLLDAGLLKPEELEKALEIQKTSNKKIGEVLVDEGFLTQRQIIEALEFQLGIPHVSLKDYFIDLEAARLVPESIAKKDMFIPIKRVNNILTVALADPLNVYAIDNIRITTGLKVEPVISTIEDIKTALSKVFDVKGLADKATKDLKDDIIPDNELSRVETASTDDAPIIKLVTSLITQSCKEGASDIHIEPLENSMRIRYRVDGILREALTTSKSIHPPLTTRIKIMSDLNIAEKRLPQDGRIKIIVDNKEVDLRISTLPTVHGEKIVIRILDKSSFLISKKELGLTNKNLQRYDMLLKNPNGMILVTGPTGSGKTTTLYAALAELNSHEQNIVTIEDPVEYMLTGINHIQVNSKIGMTFSSGLRSILRQDPNIIMIGEIRDGETAQIAIRAAMTGHLVLSTLHTNDAPSALARLIDMGIERFMVASSLVGIIAQRLVRKLCSHCKKVMDKDSVDAVLLKEMGYNFELFGPVGCKHCFGTGYRGRTSIHEILPVTRKIREQILNGGSKDKIKEIAIEEGMETLRDNGITLLKEGVISLSEMLKVTFEIDNN